MSKILRHKRLFAVRCRKFRCVGVFVAVIMILSVQSDTQKHANKSIFRVFALAVHANNNSKQAPPTPKYSGIFAALSAFGIPQNEKNDIIKTNTQLLYILSWWRWAMRWTSCVCATRVFRTPGTEISHTNVAPQFVMSDGTIASKSHDLKNGGNGKYVRRANAPVSIRHTIAWMETFYVRSQY